jgi:hypothetical protein
METMAQVTEAAKRFTFSGVTVSACQGRLYLTVDTGRRTQAEAKALVVEAKKDFVAHMIAACPGRKFNHSKVRGYSLWRQGFFHMGRFCTTGWSAGLSLVRTTEETTDITLGRSISC